MSSNRNGGVCDAILSETRPHAETVTSDSTTTGMASLTESASEASSLSHAPAPSRITGPVRLPLLAPETFVEQFNQIYGAIGMRLTAVQPVNAQPLTTPSLTTPSVTRSSAPAQTPTLGDATENRP